MFVLVGGETLNKTCGIVKSSWFPSSGNFISPPASFSHGGHTPDISGRAARGDVLKPSNSTQGAGKLGGSDIASWARLDFSQTRAGSGRYCPPCMIAEERCAPMSK